MIGRRSTSMVKRKIVAFVADVTWKLATRNHSPDVCGLPSTAADRRHGQPRLPWHAARHGSTPGGVRVSGVTAGSPADAAGIKGGDILIRIGRLQIKDLDDISERSSRIKAERRSTSC